MSKAQPRTPAYRLHKPSGQAVVTLNGRDCYLGRHGSPESRAEYDRLVAEWLLNGRTLPQSVQGGGTDLTVNEMLVAYLRHADGYYVKNGKPTVEPTNIRLAVRPLRQLYGHTPAWEFGPLGLKAVRQAMIDSGICRSEVNRRVGRVVRVFKWAVSEELVPPSIHQALQTVPGLRRGRTDVRESEPVRPVPEAFVESVRPFVSRQVWAMIELQRLTGMRPGEVVIMRTRDVDTSGRVWIYKPQTHKTEHHGHRRTIYLGPQAQAILRPWLRPDLEGVLFSPREAAAERRATMRANRKPRVQPSQRNRAKPKPAKNPGDAHDVTSYRRAIAYGVQRANRERAARGEAEIPRWHPRQPRHNAATRLRREFGLDVARAAPGSTTLATLRLVVEAGDRFEAAWNAGQNPRIEDILAKAPDPERPTLLREILAIELELRRGRGDRPTPAEYVERFPGQARLIHAVFEETTRISHGWPTVTDFEILGEVGRGGMAVVYKAQQPGLNRVVALKMILNGQLAGPGEFHRLRIEAESLARLKHPNIVQIHRVGNQGGRPCLVLEFIDGRSLAERLDGTPWPFHEAARLVETLASAIDEAHRLGIVHRDLKPANVLIASDGTPKITDFGLAKCVEETWAHTRTGFVLGTPSYMAPEQAAGTKAIGPAADVYALGATLYELLTGGPPFRGETPLEILGRVQEEEPEPPTRRRPSVPRDLETICLACLRKEPRQRYESAKALAGDLRRFRDCEPIRVRRIGVLGHVGLWCRRPQRIRDAGMLAMAYAVLVACWNGCGIVLVSLGLMLQPPRAEDFVRDQLMIIVLALIPAFWLGWNTRAGRGWALWGGAGLAVFRLGCQVAGLLGAPPDFGGYYDDPRIRGTVLSLVIMLETTLIAFHVIALTALYTRRASA